ncbi:MAG: hypothetical protein ONB23_01700 [candidate division KSB1 bacterium]|nr:hypothetical protein [candidate division KSB1 bacterium]
MKFGAHKGQSDRAGVRAARASVRTEYVLSSVLLSLSSIILLLLLGLISGLRITH